MNHVTTRGGNNPLGFSGFNFSADGEVGAFYRVFFCSLNFLLFYSVGR